MSLKLITVYTGSYPWLIYRLTYWRTNHKNLHIRGYNEEGTTTAPFAMVVRNDLDRFHLFTDVLGLVHKLHNTSDHLKQPFRDEGIEHRQYITRHGHDMPEILNWIWGG